MNARLNTMVYVTMTGIYATNILIAWCAEYTETAASARAKRHLPSLSLPHSKRSKANKPHGEPLQTVSSLEASAADPGPRSSRCFNLATIEVY